ncbi:hypothetical protein [Ferrovum myxofaciens]|nr:hypothetical protein [Ferrovum myxofaciens]
MVEATETLKDAGWVATALLGITFPVINLVSGYFAFWPLKRSE